MSEQRGTNEEGHGEGATPPIVRARRRLWSRACRLPDQAIE
jgi:hypothetical protein